LPSDSTSALPSAVRWWDALGEPGLSATVDSALAANLDLRMAAERVLEVQNQFRMARSARLPAVQGSVDGSRQNTPTNTGATGRFSESIPGFPERFDVTNWSASLGLSWELDVWGRVRASTAAAEAQWVATLADAEAVRTGVITEAIGTWARLRDLDAQNALADSQLGLLEERAGLTRSRYERGLITSFEYYAVQQALDDARAARPALRTARYDAASRLGLLMGRAAAPDVETEPNIQHTKDQPTLGLPAALPTALPSELVLRRPDLVASAARLEAARQQVGVARADQFPRFSLTASTGTQSSELADLVQTSQRFWLFGGSLTGPVFQSGARRAAARAAWNRYEQAALAHEKAVLTAFREVSVALRTLEAEHARLDAAMAAAGNARASHELQLDRYVRGVGPYVALLDAHLNKVRAEAALSAARRDVLLARLTLHRALGGAWTQEPS
jgi:multidrug efflux system outer membrane protein